MAEDGAGRSAFLWGKTSGLLYLTATQVKQSREPRPPTPSSNRRSMNHYLHRFFHRPQPHSGAVTRRFCMDSRLVSLLPGAPCVKNVGRTEHVSFFLPETFFYSHVLPLQCINLVFFRGVVRNRGLVKSVWASVSAMIGPMGFSRLTDCLEPSGIS